MMSFHHSKSPRQNSPRISNERYLIKGGKIVNHDHSFVADVYIENGVIKQVGNDQATPGGVTTINAHGLLVMPGGIDVATSLESKPLSVEYRMLEEMMSPENFYTGSKAALAGGTTTIMDFATCDKGHLLTEFESRSELAEKACCNVSLHVDVTSWNDKVLADMTLLATEKGINSFRVHMSDKYQMKDSEIYEIFKHIKSLGCVAIVHAENGDLIRKNLEHLKNGGSNGPETIMFARNEDIECEAVYRAITIGKQVSCPIFFWNVTSKAAIDIINNARTSGFPVFAQTLAVGLVQDGSCYKDSSWSKAASLITWPPLRDSEGAKEDLLSAVSNGSLSCIASGHSVYTNTQKATAGQKNCSLIPPGTNGAYERMMCLWGTAVDNGMIDENEFVAATSTNAARIFNMYPKKGHIAAGSDADLVIWDPSNKRNISFLASTLGVQKGDAENAFENAESSGGPKYVICRGRLSMDGDEITVVQGWGDIVPRKCRPSFIYQRLDAKDKIQRKNRRAIERTGGSHISNTPVVNGVKAPLPNPIYDEERPRFSRGSGHGAMHQSGWSFSGDQVDDKDQRKTGHKILEPPGGKSHIFSLG